MNDTLITRRESIKKIVKLSAGIAVASGLPLSAMQNNVFAAETTGGAASESKAAANGAC